MLSLEAKAFHEIQCNITCAYLFYIFVYSTISPVHLPRTTSFISQPLVTYCLPFPKLYCQLISNYFEQFSNHFKIKQLHYIKKLISTFLNCICKLLLFLNYRRIHQSLPQALQHSSVFFPLNITLTPLYVDVCCSKYSLD